MHKSIIDEARLTDFFGSFPLLESVPGPYHIGRAVKFSDAPSNTLEWLQARMTGFGGSDIGAVLGVNQWVSKQEVFKSKVETPVIVDDCLLTTDMHNGIHLEQAIIGIYATHTWNKVHRFSGVYRGENEWQIGNFDAVTCDNFGKIDRIVEAKYSLNPQLLDSLPLQYILQVMHYLHMTGLNTADVAVLVDNKESNTLHFTIHEIQKNSVLPGIFSGKTFKDLLPDIAWEWDLVKKNQNSSTSISEGCGDDVYLGRKKKKPSQWRVQAFLSLRKNF